MIVKTLGNLVQKVTLDFSLVILLIPVLKQYYTKEIKSWAYVMWHLMSFSNAFEQRNSKPELQSMTSRQISSGLDLTYAPSTITTQQPTERELDLLFEVMYDDYIGGQPSSATRTALAAQAPQVLQTPMTLEAQQQHVQQQDNQAPLQPEIVAYNVPNAMLDGNSFVNPFATHPLDSGFELTEFSDADYAGCKGTFKITTGGTQFLSEKLVSWSSKKQDYTKLSTAEAEYVSLSA
ncbi:retrovirus-related pol polyprotein from transposon TNT 1-94 [Tanacetum coccineum]